jgi:hypothetical protein
MLINPRERNVAPAMTRAVWEMSEFEMPSFSNNEPTIRKSNTNTRGRRPNREVWFPGRDEPEILMLIGGWQPQSPYLALALATRVPCTVSSFLFRSTIEDLKWPLWSS